MSNLPSLPPGFRFHPTDEELILCYLSQKLFNSSSYSLSIIPEVEIYKFDPWDLPEKAAFGEKEWYFFSHRDRKYPNGARPNRAAASGYWKATGTDKHILATSTNTSNKYNLLGKRHGIIGVKKSLVFYKGRPPKGLKTCWIMHEYRLFQPYSSYYKPNAMKLQLQADSSKNKLDDCVLCRIYKKPKSPATTMDEKQEELLPNLPTTPTHKPQKSSSFSELFNALDYSLLTPFQSDDHPIDQSDGFELNTPLMIGNNNNYSSSSSYSTLESRGGSDHSQQLIKRQYATEASLPTSNINNPWNNYSDQHGLLNQQFFNQYSHSPQFQR